MQFGEYILHRMDIHAGFAEMIFSDFLFWVRFICVIFNVRVYTLIFVFRWILFLSEIYILEQNTYHSVLTWAKWYFWCLDKISFSLPMNNNVLFLLLPLETLLIEFHCFNYPSFRIPARSPDILVEGTVPGISLVETSLGPPRLPGSPPRTGPGRGGSNSRRSESCSGEGLYCDVYIPNTPHFHKRRLFNCFTNNSGMSYSVTIKMFSQSFSGYLYL